MTPRKQKTPFQRHVVVDLETTGLSPARGDRIIEIGAVAIENGRLAQEFHSLVNVPCDIHPMAQRVHGISKSMLAGQPWAADVLPGFHGFLHNSVLVAHNAPFDLGFLAHEFSLLNLPFAPQYACTLQLSRSLYPELPSHRLETVYRHLFNQPPDDAHRALSDARATARLWLELGRAARQ